MVYEFIGTVYSVSERSGQGQKGPWKMWEVIIEHDTSNPQYPKRVLVSVWDENAFNEIAIAKGNGGMIKAKAGIDAREYNGRWFNDIRVFKAEQYQPQAQQIGQAMQQQAQVAPMQQQAGFTAPATPMQQPTNQTIFDGNGAGIQGNANSGELPF